LLELGVSLGAPLEELGEGGTFMGNNEWQ
jgi:hypothetical protein